MQYRCEATSVAGFIQQVAVGYLARGYYFYVPGRVPEQKDPRAVDRKLIEKYGVDVSRWERVRRKRLGLANVQYIRHDRFFLLMATHGQHRIYEEEAGQFRDARRVPIRFAGYSVSHRNGRPCVRIEVNEYQLLKVGLLDYARYSSADYLAERFARLPFLPYKPVRRQLLSVLRAVNRVRREAGLERVPVTAVPWRRPIVRVFTAVERAAPTVGSE
jgi:hypothetical protein